MAAGAIAAALGLSLAGCAQDTNALQASGARSNAAAVTADGRVMVNCGEMARPLVRQVSLGGEPVAQVECVPSLAPAYGGGYGDALAPQVVSAAPARVVPAVVEAPVRTVVRERAASPRRVVYREPARRVRSWKSSAAIIGGTTAGGAGIGALIDGKKGAAIGAGVGLAAGTIYDIATREKR